MKTEDLSVIFSGDLLENIFPNELTNQFFENLFGDQSEGAFDISLEFKGQEQDQLKFEFHLKQRPGKCLVCSLTAGLPTVFSRHPVIDVKGLVQKIDELLDGQRKCGEWQLGGTREVANDLHVIPLSISLTG